MTGQVSTLGLGLSRSFQKLRMWHNNPLESVALDVNCTVISGASTFHYILNKAASLTGRRRSLVYTACSTYCHNGIAMVVLITKHVSIADYFRSQNSTHGYARKMPICVCVLMLVKKYLPGTTSCTYFLSFSGFFYLS